MPEKDARYQSQLSRRERQIMDIVYSRGQAAAGEVHAALPDPPSYSAVRALLRILEEKGHLAHERVGLRYIYRPTQTGEKVRSTALQHLVKTFFGGSIGDAMVALLDQDNVELSDADLERIAKMIRDARKRGRQP